MRLVLRWMLIIALLTGTLIKVARDATQVHSGGGYVQTPSSPRRNSIEGLMIIQGWVWECGDPVRRGFGCVHVGTPYVDASGTARDGAGWITIQQPFQASIQLDDGTLLGDINVPNIMDNHYFKNRLGLAWSSDGLAFDCNGIRRELALPKLNEHGDFTGSPRRWIGFRLLLGNSWSHLKPRLPWLFGGIVIVLCATSRAAEQYVRPKRGHCLACDYSLHGNESGVCPECGTVIDPGRRASGSFNITRTASRVFIWIAIAVLGFSLLYAMGANGAYRITRGMGGCEPGPKGWIGIVGVPPGTIALMSLGPLSTGLALSFLSTLLSNPTDGESDCPMLGESAA